MDRLIYIMHVIDNLTPEEFEQIEMRVRILRQFKFKEIKDDRLRSLLRPDQTL